MRPVLLVAVVALVCVLAPAQDAQVGRAADQARKRYEESLANARRGYDRAARQATLQYASALKRAMEAETRAGNLDAALVLREQIKKLETEGTPNPAATPQAQPTARFAAFAKRLVDSQWTWETDGTLKFNADGTGAFTRDDGTTHPTRWAVWDNHNVALMKTDTGYAYRLIFNSSQTQYKMRLLGGHSERSEQTWVGRRK